MIFALLAPLLSLAFWLARPTSASCPIGWYVEGVRRDGSARCIRPPAGRGELECVRGSSCGPFPAAAWTLPMRIYCAPPAVPVVVDARRVRCRRGA